MYMYGSHGLTLTIWSLPSSHPFRHALAAISFAPPPAFCNVARWYAQHPEGTGGDAPPEGAADLPTAEIIDACEDFVELTGSAGDVVLMHPFMLHAFSVNATDRPRIITNPAPTLKAPMRFDRHPAPSSPVEALILKALGTHSFPFEPTTPRESNFVPHHFRGEASTMLWYIFSMGTISYGVCARCASCM